MDKQQMLEYYKESYYHEFVHKDSINGRVSIPAGILPLLAGADIFLINNIKDLDDSWFVWGTILVILFTLALFFALYYIFRTLYNHKYGYTATPKEIYDYRKSLEGKYDESIIDAEMGDFLSTEFANYASLNRKSNLSKVFYLRIVYYWIVAALIVGLLCIPVFIFGKSNGSDITRVQITNIPNAWYYNN